ncbi:MAG: L,D-transpeptidase [Oculatellaceae cyanobacterium bins.114]|nr:L,D-transpeptidase [Oculatellaceae cyanobacterium bins.114]
MQRLNGSKSITSLFNKMAIAPMGELLRTALAVGIIHSVLSSAPVRADSLTPGSPIQHSFSFSYVEVRIPDLPPLAAPTHYLPTIEELNPHVVLKLGQRRVYLYQGDRVLASYPVAIGRSDTPTPTGQFQVFQLIENPRWQSPWTGEVTPPGPNSALGLRWIGFARRPNGIIGFHGTPTLSSIGQAASNGCVRMRNADVIALFERVEMGTTVIVEP